MEDENPNVNTRKVATKMVAALASTDNRNRSRLEALENDNAGIETVETSDDDDDEDGYGHKRQADWTKRKTRQAKGIGKCKESATDIRRTLALEAMSSHVPNYLEAAVGPRTSPFFALFVGLQLTIHV